MKRHRGTFISHAILIMQFIPGGVLATPSAAYSISSEESVMCGGAGHHFLSSSA